MIFFLSTRAAVWLIAKPLGTRAIFYAVTCGALAIGIKYTPVIFLPLALISLTVYFAGKERLMQLIRLKTIITALCFLIPVTGIILLPDYLVNANRGVHISDQLHYLSKVHASSPLYCGVAHFLLRLFEFSFDFFRMLITFSPISIAAYLPVREVLPQGCTFDNPLFAFYAQQGSIMRENTDFGLLFLLSISGLLVARGTQRLMVLFSLGLFFVSVAAYSFNLTYLTGTGRYFIDGFLILLPACLIAVLGWQQRLSSRHFKLAVVLLMLPMMMIAIKSNIGINKTPSFIIRGAPHEYRAEGLIPALKTLDGKVNIYFNDLMPFYTLLRLIPSRDVTLKKSLIADATNIIAVPREYSVNTNWHDDFWFLPIPAAGGKYMFMGPVRKSFGNKVPSAFFMTAPQSAGKDTQRFDLHAYTPGTDAADWVKSLGKQYRQEEFAGGGIRRNFIHTAGATEGLCVINIGAEPLWWHTGTMESCRDIDALRESRFQSSLGESQ